jgi:predicted nuclease with TOPRIM domain
MAKSVAQWREENLALQKEVVRLETSLSCNQERMSDLEKRCSDLHEQVIRLQDALVAKESPDVYADRKEDEDLPALTPEEEQRLKRDSLVAEANGQLLQKMGQDSYFSNAQDMMEILTGGDVPEFESLHGNDEG